MGKRVKRLVLFPGGKGPSKSYLSGFSPLRKDFRILRNSQIGRFVQADWVESVKLLAESILEDTMSEGTKRDAALRELKMNRIAPTRAFITGNQTIVLSYNFEDGRVYWAAKSGLHKKLHEKYEKRFTKEALRRTKASEEDIQKRLKKREGLRASETAKLKAGFKHLNPEKISAIFKLANGGLKIAQIAKELGIPTTTVYYQLKKTGIKGYNIKKYLTSEQKAEIRRLRQEEGYSESLLAKKFNVSQPGIRYVLTPKKTQ